MNVSKYEILIFFMVGFVVGVLFLGKYGGEYQRGMADGYQKSQTQWNELIGNNAKQYKK